MIFILFFCLLAAAMVLSMDLNTIQSQVCSGVFLKSRIVHVSGIITRMCSNKPKIWPSSSNSYLPTSEIKPFDSNLLLLFVFIDCGGGSLFSRHAIWSKYFGYDSRYESARHKEKHGHECDVDYKQNNTNYNKFRRTNQHLTAVWTKYNLSA